MVKRPTGCETLSGSYSIERQASAPFQTLAMMMEAGLYKSRRTRPFELNDFGINKKT